MRAALAAAAVAALALTGCASTPAPEASSAAPAAASTSAAAPSPAATATALPPVATLAELAGTRWGGLDSEGDTLTFDFEEGGQVAFYSFGERYSADGDVWSADGATLTWRATFGFPYGTCTYVGAFDVEAQVILAPYTCDREGAPSGTIELEQRPM